jgi:tripartite-type tricarboxylate transporter receptor subunit TctC
MKSFLTLALLARSLLACSLSIDAAHAAFPDHPVTLVVPYAPGGAGDVQARQLAARMGTRLGATTVVDNRPGASGVIGKSLVARAPADGHTLLFDATPSSINPALMPTLPFSDANFQPLTLVSLTPNVLVVGQGSPIKDQADLIARARAHPGKLTFASGGSGTVQRMAAELYRQGLDLDVLHVPYKSGTPAITAVMAGEVDFMFSNMAACYPLISSGKLRALAISSPRRSPLLPEVPTVAESVLPGYEAFEWAGLLLPAGTPPPVAAQLHKAVVESLQDEALKKRFADLGAQPVGNTPAEFTAFLQKEAAKWRETVRKGHIQLD